MNSTFDQRLMIKIKRIRPTSIGVMIGIFCTLISQPISKYSMDFFGPPSVTIMNVTGEEISEITISLGEAKRHILKLKDGQAVTVLIIGDFSEGSTQVSWTDSLGKHDEKANDYMESYGFYHSKVVVTPERKLKAIYEI